MPELTNAPINKADLCLFKMPPVRDVSKDNVKNAFPGAPKLATRGAGKKSDLR